MANNPSLGKLLFSAVGKQTKKFGCICIFRVLFPADNNNNDNDNIYNNDVNDNDNNNDNEC